MNRPIQIVFDAGNPTRLADFWAVALGYVRQPPPPGYDTWEAFAADRGIPEDQWEAFDALVDPDGDGPRILFQKVPEGKVAKNRVHLDVHVGGSQDVDPALTPPSWSRQGRWRSTGSTSRPDGGL